MGVIKKNGISLVILIITIVVLILLTAVVIITVLEDNNIIEKAKQAVEEYNIAEEQELLTTKLMNFKIYMETNPQSNEEFLGDTMANYFKTNNIDVIVVEGFPSSIIDDESMEMSKNINIVKYDTVGLRINNEMGDIVSKNICIKPRNSNYVYEVDGRNLIPKGEATRKNENENVLLPQSFNWNGKEFNIKKLGLQQADESEANNGQSNGRLVQTEDMKELIKEINEIENIIYGARAKGEVNYTNLNNSKNDSTLTISSEIILGISRYIDPTKNIIPAEDRIRDTDNVMEMSFNVNGQRYTIEKCIRGLERGAPTLSDETYVASIRGNKLVCNITKSGVIVMNQMRNANMESLLRQ